ncbi:MAG: bifunctional adenosylcobinamide kinase/adenosylcobinamide-phosphate guanylyltransferase [Pseudomonadota bacterium]
MKPSLVLVLGGARSGKSRYAESLARVAGAPVSYIATAGPPRDDEMAARIAAHQARRPADWITIDAPLDLAEALANVAGVAVVDCLTLWLTNVVLAEKSVGDATDALLSAMAARAGSVVAVSNEVGEGIVPATSLGRRFRDHQGVLNQRVAEVATDVVKVVAGCPVVIKPRPQPEISL